MKYLLIIATTNDVGDIVLLFRPGSIAIEALVLVLQMGYDTESFGCVKATSRGGVQLFSSAYEQVAGRRITRAVLTWMNAFYVSTWHK